MVLRPDRTEVARKIFEKWELDFAIVGMLTDSGRITVRHKGTVEADIPLGPLADEAPIYDRPTVPYERQPALTPPAAPCGVEVALARLLSSGNGASRAWIWNQYDSGVGGQTVKRPGGADAAIVRVEGTNRGLAMTTDCTPRYGQADPYIGGAQAVVEVWRNITATGARPLAMTDNLNFASPENPRIMAQFVEAVKGIGDAGRALDFPVVSGNVSLYNETRGDDGSVTAIQPAPVIGGVGVLEDVHKAVGLAFPDAGEILLIGETIGTLGQSLWLKEILNREEGAPPAINFEAERRNGDFVRGLIQDELVTACHDVSDGGLLLAVAEMAMAGGIGCSLADAPADMPAHAYWFGEDQARYVVVTQQADSVIKAAQGKGVPVQRLGHVGGDTLKIGTEGALTVGKMQALHASFFPRFMGQEDAPLVHLDEQLS